MKIKFEELEYQKQAWESAVGVFEGQELCNTTFSMPSRQDGLELDNIGYGNKLKLVEDEVLENVREIQIKNGLAQSEVLPSSDFTIEMETGTGKTYVYLRSIFEMHQKYGFSKFIIVVPSIAIKEGVYKALQMTEDNFKNIYDKTPYEYFLYDSNKLEKVRNFSTNSTLQIMVINIDAFRKSFSEKANKETRIMHRWNDKMRGVPIDFISQTNPVVIIDEPQSVDTTDKSKESIASLNPLCTFRYSATHIEKHNMLYKLDSIDAYEQQLVKQIEVASIETKDGHNNAYIKLLKVENKDNVIRAQIEVDMQQKENIKRTKKWVKQGQDLAELTKREVYEGYQIQDIYCEDGNEYIDFTSNSEFIKLNQSIGDVDWDSYKRLQIRKTIEEHLEKELRLTPKGIKVLSLFFIDKVAHYRWYDADNNPQQGKYYQMFEEEYKKIIQKPKYHSLFGEVDIDSLVESVHNGYFSQDKKGVLKDTKGTTAADEDTYTLIMKDKEKLLSFDSKLKFIFSHSALKEGWDNPNVFQICTLNETNSVIKKRQEIGRGLRIAVNQDGQRVHGFDTNTLTVMANESYEKFVSELQTEMEKEGKITFGVIENHLFANIVITSSDGSSAYLGQKASENIWTSLYKNEYIDKKGKATDSLKEAIREEKVVLPEEFEENKEQIVSLMKKVVKGLEIKNNADRKSVKLNKEVYYSPEFKDLWDKIKYKTIYNVDFDADTLIKNCSDRIKEELYVGKTKFGYFKDKLAIDKGGISAEKGGHKENTYDYDIIDYNVPDILSDLQGATNLKRDTLVQILIKSEKLHLFKNNPQKFIDMIKKLIRLEMQKTILDGIKYEKIGDGVVYTQEIFETEELKGYLTKNMVAVDKSIYDHVIYDSDVEHSLALKFESDEQVKVYLKLPPEFKIDTPLGGYNPDWAVLFEKDGEEKLYFVLESKGTLFEEGLKGNENYKIKCGRKHFEALDTGVKYEVVSSHGDFIDKAMAEK